MTMEQTETTQNIGAPISEAPPDSLVGETADPNPVAQQESSQPAQDAQPAQPAQDAQPGIAGSATPQQSTGEPAPQVASQYSPEHIQALQQQSAQYAQLQAQAALQNQATQYRQQLESQGFIPEHAQQATNEYVQSQQRQTELIQQAEQYGRHIHGKQLAAEHFVQKYNLNIGDLAELRKYNDPESMDKGAQKLSNDRRRDEELSKFKQGQVPAQAVDNSQGNPQVAADEGGWLDRYNAGDRSPSAVAAAARAAGVS
jgi:hypothetical protein